MSNLKQGSAILNSSQEPIAARAARRTGRSNVRTWIEEEIHKRMKDVLPRYDQVGIEHVSYESLATAYEWLPWPRGLSQSAPPLF